MNIKVTNFGPVARASLKIAPITVIIGRNNLGKSFLSQLVFSVLSSLSSRRTIPFFEAPEFSERFNFARWGLLDIPTAFIAEQIIEDNDGFRRIVRSFKRGEISRDKAIQSLAKYCADYLAVSLDEIFFDQLERTFGVAPGDLVRLGKNKSTISISMSPHSYFLIMFRASGKHSTKLRLDYDHALTHLYNNRELLSSPESVKTKTGVRRQTEKLMASIKSIVFDGFNITRAFYLPAGRGGLMDSWETISTAWTALAPVAIPRGISMPPLPGTSAMFYTILQSLSGGRRKGDFYNTKDAFRRILGGDLEITMDYALKGKRNIEYVLNINNETRKINIIHAASMVKELGPLYLIVQEVLRKNDLFIVEEPESHLHPTAQRDFMKIMIGLVEQGVYVLFTTHSDLLLRSVGHFVYESSKKKDGNTVSLSSLSVNLVKETEKGSVSNNIRLTRKGAIESLPTFDEVTNELYDEELRLERDRNQH